MKIYILWIIFALLAANSFSLLTCKSTNAGSIMTYILTICSFIYALFSEQSAVFFSSGIGEIIKYLFLAFAAMLIMLALVALFAPRPPIPNGGEKALIVLGAGIVGERITNLLRLRLNAAFKYYEKHRDIIIITSGGQGPHEARPEGEIMREYLIGLGVPADKIIAENKSTSTEENFAFSLSILKSQGFSTSSPIIFTTNGFHCFRAGIYAKKAGFTAASCLPASIGIGSILPCYMREGLALIYYYIFKR